MDIKMYGSKQDIIDMIKIDGVKEVKGTLSKKVRSALDKAVRKGELRHIERQGLKTEVYYDPSCETIAKQLRANREKQRHDASIGLFASVSKKN